MKAGSPGSHSPGCSFLGRYFSILLDIKVWNGGGSFSVYVFLPKNENTAAINVFKFKCNRDFRRKRHFEVGHRAKILGLGGKFPPEGFGSRNDTNPTPPTMGFPAGSSPAPGHIPWHQLL